MNEKRRGSFRVIHLFSLFSRKTKSRRGAMLGPQLGPWSWRYCPGFDPDNGLRNAPQSATGLVTTQCVTSICWDLSRSERHAVSWPAAMTPLVCPLIVYLTQNWEGAMRDNGRWAGTLGKWKHRNQDATTLKRLKGQEEEKKPQNISLWKGQNYVTVRYW